MQITMPNHKASIASFYLLALAIALASAMPAGGYSSTNGTPNAITELTRGQHNSSHPALHKHNATHPAQHKPKLPHLVPHRPRPKPEPKIHHSKYRPEQNVVEIVHHHLVERDAIAVADDHNNNNNTNTNTNKNTVDNNYNDTATKTRPLPGPHHPTAVISIKKGGGDAGTRDSDSDSNSSKIDGSYTDSSGITYGADGSVTSIPLGATDPIYMPFGGIYNVPGWNAASALDGSVVVARAMVFSIVTVLVVCWML
ncbi:hypothetical protein F4859DRAFT_205232 [Xylaria cf. heliscus]|nr:hypothetical protein F4859DRAFT_205232 [Xylaria cf. heliscus]